MTPLTLENARLVLETLGRWRCEQGLTADVPVDSFLAVSQDAVTGSVRRRVILARDAASMEVARWAAADSAGTGLLVLAGDKAEAGSVETVRRAVKRLRRDVQVELWPDLLARLAGVDRIRARYAQLFAQHEQTEGEDFVYVDPDVTEQDSKLVYKLRGVVDAMEASGTGSVVYLVSDYGEGKTSFCLDYVFRRLLPTYAQAGGSASAKSDAVPTLPGAQAGGIPLLFMLNESESASLAAHVQNHLFSDYGLSLSFSELSSLCRAGVFIPVLDAFDQMQHSVAGTLAIGRDLSQVVELSSGCSPVFVTCRLQFFHQLVKPLRGRSTVVGEESSTILTLHGFANDDIDLLLGSSPLRHLWASREVQQVLGGLLHKPLMLRVMTQHAVEFQALVQRRIAEARAAVSDGQAQVNPITAYDVFDMLFENWLVRKDFRGLTTRRGALQLSRLLAKRARLEMLNVAFPFAELPRETDGDLDLATDEKRAAVLEDLKTLPLLDQATLRGSGRILFRFTIYLEALTARFALEELRGADTDNDGFLKREFLNTETRQLIAPQLTSRAGDHQHLLRAVEATRHKHFDDVRYQAGNALTLLLDKLLDGRLSAKERERWREALRNARLEHTTLRRLDARGADLAGLDFSHCDLRDADLSFAVLRNARFVLADLTGAQILETGPVLTAAFIRRAPAADDSWLLAGGTETGLLVLWESSRAFSRRTRPHVEAMTAVAMEEGGRLFGASLDGAVSESDVGGPHVVGRYPLGLGSLRALAVAADGPTVIAGGDRRVLVARNMRDGSAHRLRLPRPQGAVMTGLVLDGPSDTLFAGDNEGELYRFDEWRVEGEGRGWGDPSARRGGVRTLLALSGGALLVMGTEGEAMVLGADGREQDETTHYGRMDAVCYAYDIDTLYWVRGSTLYSRQRGAAASPPAQRYFFDWRDATTREPVVMACTPDGSLVAVGGSQLEVLLSGRKGIQSVRRDAMHLDCAGMILDRCRGLDQSTLDLLVRRGAAR